MNRFDEEFGGVLSRPLRKEERAKGEWECTRCGYIRVGVEPPATCPECGATALEFEFWEFEEEDSDQEDYE